jgi:uncharacterized protein YjiS (DUF1127 family)
MSTLFRRWRQSRTYRAIVRELRSLPPAELSALGIAPAEIERLAREAADQAAPAHAFEPWRSARLGASFGVDANASLGSSLAAGASNGRGDANLKDAVRPGRRRVG